MRFKNRRSVLFYLLICGCCVFSQAQTIASRITGPINENQVTTLLGNVHPMARAEFDQGVVSAETSLPRMIFQLEPSPAQQAALDALVEAQQDPRSPLYHQWLTPAEYGARFGASPQDLARISSWLSSRGFTVNEIPASNRQVIFSGNAGQVEDTFHTEIHHFRVNGVDHIANTQDPQIPTALAGVVGGIVSLHNFRSVSQIRSRTPLSNPQYTNGSTHYLFPADFAAIYDLNPLYKAGTSGSGGSIAIVGRSNINLQDVAKFRSAAGLAANNAMVILVNTNPGLVAGDQDESTLDVEWSGAVAPAATVKFVTAASTATTDGIDLAAQYIVNHATATVMSTSYGSCEADMGSAEMSFYNSLWQQAASEGISSFVSSGDSGAAGCDGGSSTSGTRKGVNGLCSSPYSTCVGGTEFKEGSGTYWSSTNGAGNGSALGYIPEEVWNESAASGGSGLWSSGGGASVFYSQPAWQKGLSGTSAANGMRAVPDVAMTAAAHDGYIIVEDGSDWVISGTSAASPSFAGLMALVVQSKGGKGQGNVNAALYGLLSASKNPFHATPSGSNSVPGVVGFTAAGAAYNLATGLGSVDGASLLSVWGGGSSTTKPGVDFSLAPSATSGTAAAGKTVTFTLGVTESSGGKNKVSFSATAPTGVSGSISPSSVSPGSNATVTVTTAPTIAPGAKAIAITATDSTGSQAATYTLTVTPPPTLTLNAMPSSIVLAQGVPGTVSLSAVTGGSFSGSIAYSLSKLPAGVTAKWSANPQTPPASTSTNNETLTLITSTAPMAASMATLVVTAAGDGLAVSRSVLLQVQPTPSKSLPARPVSTGVKQ